MVTTRSPASFATLQMSTPASSRCVILLCRSVCGDASAGAPAAFAARIHGWNRSVGEPSTHRSEEHTSELQSLMRISYAVFCLQQKNKHATQTMKIMHYRAKD